MKNKLQKITKLSTGLCFLFILVIGLQVSFFLKPQKAAAEEQNNAMLLLVEHCQGVQDEDKAVGISVNSDIHGGGRDDDTTENCKGYKDILNDKAGCSDKLFKKSRVASGEDVYYLDTSLFRDCFKKVKAQYERLGGSDCNGISDGTPGWDTCKNNMENLFHVLGCDRDIFQNPDSQDRRFLKGNAYSSCGQRVGQMSAIHLKYIDSNGNVQTMKKPLGATDEEFNGDDGASGSSASGSNIDDADCDPAFGLGWIACSASEFMANFAKDIFESVIGPMLENVPVSLDRSGSESGAFKAWQAIRVIANALLVVSLLAVVYSQAKGGD